MTGPAIARIIFWAARHFLVTWAIAFVIATVAVSWFGVQSDLVWRIWFFTMAPFVFVLPAIKQLFQSYGPAVVGIAVTGTIASIYIALDIALWAVIRSARRGAALRKRADNDRTSGIQDRVDLVSAGVMRYAFPLWALIVGVALYVGIGFEPRGEIYQPNLLGTVIYGGLLLALPIMPFISILDGLGVDMKDPVIRAVVLTSFVILCFILDMVSKRHLRKAKSLREHDSPLD